MTSTAPDLQESNPTAAPIASGDLSALQRQGVTPTTIGTAQRLMGNRAVLRMIADKSASHSQSCGCGACHAVQRQTASTAGRVQRHSSFEHKMLGDVSPDMLQIIASQDNLSSHSGTAHEDIRDNEGKVTGNQTIKAQGGPYDGQVINKDMVKHVLAQEIARINYFKNQSEPKAKQQNAISDVSAAKDYQADLRNKDLVRQNTILGDEAEKGNMFSEAGLAALPNWDVQIVAVSSKDNFEPLLVSYGEMNTLADIYGSSAELRQADPVDRWKIVQGIRQQSLFRFLDMQNKIEGNSTNKPYLGEGFDGAYGNTGRGDNVGPLPMGEISLALTSKKGAKPTEAYTSTLARNACHFAPESWYSWANYHKTGLKRAKDGYDLKQLVATDGSPENKKVLSDKADEAYNDALLENGFGDHYLQDSYAAGHLINKTGIMMEFIKWMDQHPDKWDFMTEKNWRQLQNLAYNQKGLGQEASDGHYNVDNVGKDNFAPKDPQSVENLDGNWVKRFNATGLQVPLSLQPGTDVWDVTVWFQERSLGFFGSNTATFADVVDQFKDVGLAEKSLRQLTLDGTIYIDGQSQKDRGDMLNRTTPLTLDAIKKSKFVLDNGYRPSDKDKFRKVVGDYRKVAKNPLSSQQEKTRAAQGYMQLGAQVEYNAFHMMLKNTAIQLATNVMHNKFCKEGLEVKTGNGDQLGRIYGDDNMNNKDSQKGVQHSATTSHWSRESITSMFETGVEPADKTTNIIAQRFPTEVKVGNEYKNIGAWHGTPEFANWMDQEFSAAGTRAKVGGLATIDTVKKVGLNVVTLGLINLGEKSADIGDVTAVVSKDEAHAGDVF